MFRSLFSLGVWWVVSIGPALAREAQAGAPPANPAAPAKVVILGLDGVSLNVLEPYIDEGLTPNLAALIQGGSAGHLESFWPTRTPQVWTSAVTGKLPGQHGIWDHLANTYFVPPALRSAEKKIVTSRDRRSKALWNLLDAQGLRNLVVGWMVTSPAEPLAHGVIVAPVELSGDKRQTSIKGSFYRDIKDTAAAVQPAALWPTVQKLVTEPDEVGAEELGQYVDPSPLGPSLAALPSLGKYIQATKWTVARSRSVEAITLALAPSAKPDVVYAYFECADTIGHRLWIFKESEEQIAQRLRDLGLPPANAAELKRRFGQAYAACYRDMDQRVGRILQATRGPDTLVLVISDHGFGHAERPHPFKEEPYGGVHLDQGILIAAGPGVRVGQRVAGVSILDITPTVLHYLGQPAAQDMRGRVAEAIFTPEYAKSHPVKTVPTYEAAPQSDCPFAEGYPKRTIPPRRTEDQMRGRNPYL
jgi:predicted AlkP superfamily phosphohydrolase/phosphomutase